MKKTVITLALLLFGIITNAQCLSVTPYGPGQTKAFTIGDTIHLKFKFCQNDPSITLHTQISVGQTRGVKQLADFPVNHCTDDYKLDYIIDQSTYTFVNKNIGGVYLLSFYVNGFYCMNSLFQNGSPVETVNLKIITTTDIFEYNNHKTIIETVCYGLDGMIIDKPTQGLFIKKTYYSDGSFEVTKYFVN